MAQAKAYLASLPTPRAGQALSKKHGVGPPALAPTCYMLHMVSGSADMTDLPLV